MSTRRRLAISALIVAFGTGWAWQMATGRDDWPLSSVGMFSRLQSPGFSRVVLVGVSEGGEVPLDDSLMRPLGSARLLRALRILHDSRRDPSPFLELVRHRYDDRRAAGVLQGPDLIGMRMYRHSWELRSDLSNVDAPERALLFEQSFRDRRGGSSPSTTTGRGEPALSPATRGVP
jgi:hypothetical protein